MLLASISAHDLVAITSAYHHTPYTQSHANSQSNLILKLIHKPLMKLRNLPHPLRARSQERRSEMQRALLLAEAGARDNTDARSVEESGSVEFVWVALFGLCLLDGLLGDGDCWEEIH